MPSYSDLPYAKCQVCEQELGSKYATICAFCLRNQLRHCPTCTDGHGRLKPGFRRWPGRPQRYCGTCENTRYVSLEESQP
jgi:hypothetical protein